MTIDEIIEKWECEAKQSYRNTKDCHQFVNDLRALKATQNDDVTGNDEELLNRIEELEEVNDELRKELKHPKKHDITLDTDEIEKDVAIRVLAEMVAEKPLS